MTDTNRTRKAISYAFAVFSVVFIAASIYFFYAAAKIRQELIERAGNDPFAVVFVENVDRASSQANEVMVLNYRRSKNENLFRVSVIIGAVQLACAFVARPRRGGPQRLGL